MSVLPLGFELSSGSGGGGPSAIIQAVARSYAVADFFRF